MSYLPFNAHNALSWEKSKRDVQFTTRLYLLLRLRMSAAIPLLRYTFMAMRIVLT
jgi:hypothetical protein